jgi:hypothetical protein
VIGLDTVKARRLVCSSFGGGGGGAAGYQKARATLNNRILLEQRAVMKRYGS